MRRPVLMSAAVVAPFLLTVAGAQSMAGTAFTIQGILKDGGQSSAGVYDLSLSLFGAPTGGNRVAGPVIIEDLMVDSGV